MTADIEECQRLKTLNKVTAYSRHIQNLSIFSEKAATASAVAQTFLRHRAGGGMTQCPPPLYPPLNKLFFEQLIFN